MAIKIADIFANLTVKTDDYDRGLSAAQGKASSFSNVLQGIFQGVGQQLFRGIVSGIESFVGEVGGAIQASSDLNESINKTGVVFGESAQQVLDWSKTAATALGLSQQKALEAASSFGAFFVQMGKGKAEAAQMSENLLRVATDLGSINNLDPAAVSAKIKAGLIGESEPLRSLNILLTEHTVAQKAVQLGLAQSTDAVSEQAKAMARYQLIVEQSGYAQGDFARTSGDLANAQRILAAEIEDGSAKLGNSFRPALTAITNTLIEIAPVMFQYAQNIMDQFASGLADGINTILPVIQTIKQFFTYWFAPGSPPRVAPQIDKWGAAAMGQFLLGFSSVDVKAAIGGIGSAIENILRSDVAAGKGDEGNLVGKVLGSRNAIAAAVAEFKQIGSVSQSTIDRIARSAGSSGGAVASLVKSYFDLQKATDAVNRAQSQLNSITERYDAIIRPLQSQLDGVRAEQQKLADQQRLIAAKNVLASFDSTVADKRAAQLEIEQISLEQQIAGAEQKKKAETDAAQAGLDGAKKQQDAAQKQVDIAQATIDQQVQVNNLLGEQRQLEERLAKEREAEAKKQQQMAEQLHQAQLQYNLSLADTSGKIAILRGELANTTAGSAEYYRIQEQINALEKQQAAEADRVTDAQFEYNLSLVDTAGKIALYQQKLAGLQQGSVEYYQTLTRIHELEKQRAKELEKQSSADFGGGIGGAFPKLNTEVSAGGEKLKKAIEDAQKALNAPSGDPPEWMVNLKKFLKEDLPAAFEPIKKAIEDLVAQIKIRFPEIKDDTQQTLGTMGQLWKDHGDLVSKLWSILWEEIGATLKFGIDLVTGAFTTFVGAITLNWTTFTKGLGEIWAAFWTYGRTLGQTEAERIKAFLDEFFPGALASVKKFVTDSITEITGLYTSFKTAGAKIVDSLWDGLKSKWDELSGWFSEKLQGLRDKLPFSEPKDPSSPLRGLAKSGAAMVNMVQAGIAQASLSIEPLANSLLPQQAAPVTNNNSTSSMTFNITVNGAGDAGIVKQGAKDGILEALRAAGLA